MQPSFFQRIRQLFLRRSFFLRLLAMLLGIICIPLLFMSIYYVNEKKETICQQEQAQLQTVARAVTSQLDEYIDVIRATDIRIKSDPYFINRIRERTITGEMELINSLELLQVTMPFVSDYGFYLPQQRTLYLASGKYDASIFAEYVLGITKEAFLGLLKEQTSACFVSWYPQKKAFSFIIPPMVGASAGNGMTGYYQLDGSTLLNTLKGVLPDPYRLFQLETEEGALLYQSNLEITEEDYLIYAQMGHSRIRATVCVARSQLADTMDELSNFFRLLSLLCIVQLMVVVVVAAFVGYRPVWQAFHKVRSTANLPYAGQSEMEYILDAFDDSLNERRRIEQHLHEEHRLLVERTMECLLLGKPITQAEHTLIPLASMSRYCVVCAQTRALRNANPLFNQEQGSIRTLEIYNDGVIALICHLRDSEHNSREDVVAFIRELLNDAIVPLGVSRVMHTADTLAQAYQEAKQALLTPQVAANRFFEDLSSKPAPEEYDCTPTSALSEVQKKLIQYTDEHYCDADFGVMAVADHLSISEYMAGKLLRGIYGANYSRLINERRIEYAKELLLSTDESIASVAEKSGLRSASYFIRVFRSSEGITPSAWRQYMREQQDG